MGWGALWLALTALAYISHPVYLLGPLIALLGLGALLAGRGHIWRRGQPASAQPWLRAAVMLVAGALLLIPFYGPLLTDAGRAEMRDVAETGRVTYAPMRCPSPARRLLAGWVIGDSRRIIRATCSAPTRRGTAYVGAVALALARSLCCGGLRHGSGFWWRRVRRCCR